MANEFSGAQIVDAGYVSADPRVGDYSHNTIVGDARALAEGVSVEALGREVRAEWVAWAQEQPHPKSSWLVPWEGLGEADREVDRRIGERLFALGRASVVPPDADLARVIAAWPALDGVERAHVLHYAERVARYVWRDVAERVLSPEGSAELDRVRVTLHWSTAPGLLVVSAEVWMAAEPRAPTVEEWAKLRAAGVPVAEDVGA